jgi:hypothetical protein
MSLSAVYERYSPMGMPPVFKELTTDVASWATVGAVGDGVGEGLREAVTVAAIVAAAAAGFAGVGVLFVALLHPASVATARRGNRNRRIVWLL